MSLPLSTLILIPAAALAAVLLATSLSPIVKIPVVVFEILLGMTIGPSMLGWVEPIDFTEALSTLGLVMLFFMAGYEIDFGGSRAGHSTGPGWAGSSPSRPGC